MNLWLIIYFRAKYIPLPLELNVLSRWVVMQSVNDLWLVSYVYTSKSRGLWIII